MNAAKSKVMKYRRDGGLGAGIVLNVYTVEQVVKFTYL